ncbi:toll/interleukin-1 receptor domain-containing protein [Chitinimonas taiwanensis]|uniref:toll/interleukin-1 receptor domain-containing protein n=1 Tax=Chitinimonas taiwanensis TaxID=240412 RepID=UPI0035B052A1
MHDKEFDVFISHASEDKDAIVFPLADQLRGLGVKVWYDEFELKIGNSLSRTIDHGLAQSAFGIVVISPDFLRKNWPEYELRGLISREVGGERIILPIWHNVSREDVLQYSPPLADKMALATDGRTSPQLVRELVKVIRPDIHQQFLRAVLARTNALKNLKEIVIEDIHHGAPRHPSLPQQLMARIIAIHALTEEILPMSLSETIHSFQCDTTPEKEVRVWERIVACYYLATTGESFSTEKKRDIFAVLLAASMGPIGDTEREFRGSLKNDEIDSLVTLYDSDLSSI